MHRLVHFAPIDSTDAKDIHRLQKRLFPPDLRESIGEIAALLKKTEEHMVCNLSFALFDDSKMVGYVFAYVEAKSVYHERDEEVVYIKEVALLPGYEVMLRRLFEKLFQLWSAFALGTPLEAHVLEESLRNWKRMVRFFRYYGLSLSTKSERAEDGRPPYQLLRLDVDPGTSSLAEKSLGLPQADLILSDDINVSVITEPRQWLALRQDWCGLLSNTTDSNVFQSFDYLWLWWKFQGIWNDLRVIVIRRRDTVIGTVPLMIEHFSVYGRTVRKLMFITAPMEMSRPKFMFGSDNSKCMSAFFSYLANSENEWDIFDIDEQIAGAQTDDLYKELESRHYLVAESETLCPYIEMDADWQGFVAQLPRKMRSNINRLRRRIAKLGEVNIRCVSQWPQLDDAMDKYCEIESRSWKFKKSLHIASDKEDYFFYLGLARVFGQRNKFELRVLECEGEPIASTFGIRKDGVFQSLKIAHDMKFDRYSPGTVLESFELEELFASDVETYEFMGSFLANKLRWTSAVYKTSNVHVYQRRPRLQIYFFVYFVFKRHAKKILQKLGQFDKADRMLKKWQDSRSRQK